MSLQASRSGNQSSLRRRSWRHYPWKHKRKLKKCRRHGRFCLTGKNIGRRPMLYLPKARSRKKSPLQKTGAEVFLLAQNSYIIIILQNPFFSYIELGMNLTNFPPCRKIILSNEWRDYQPRCPRQPFGLNCSNEEPRKSGEFGWNHPALSGSRCQIWHRFLINKS